MNLDVCSTFLACLLGLVVISQHLVDAWDLNIT